MDLPFTLDFLGANPEPDNALTIAWYVLYRIVSYRVINYHTNAISILLQVIYVVLTLFYLNNNFGFDSLG